MIFLKKQKKTSDSDDFFIALSDIMTALMLLFLLISIVYMIKVEDSVRVPKIFKETTQGLSERLNKEFDKDLKGWGAVLDKDLTIRFYQPDILFKTGSWVLSPKFKEILNEFFPRYLKIMMDKQFVNNIEEIRIEGHTSSFWGNIKGDTAYLNNMELSQARTREVIKYLLSLKLDKKEKEWLKKHFRAIGFSSAKPLNDKSQTLQKGEKENFINSQRVEFRVRTNIENKIAEVVNK
ncbi:OmpA family protein [Helicobacter sp. 11-8110]|uniref:OmpA/MotB family protein n=1 Tax=Helicobacter sp. 11-8110 TaxID=2004997 RepID=UPI000DCD8645|nr:OmpA family protein [Helicobacter sp. 11-8110]RAX52145.1 hypothetical protein CCY98_05775 [Helicobacter sp. 11-8110]